jgi:hypothetical protein
MSSLNSPLKQLHPIANELMYPIIAGFIRKCTLFVCFYRTNVNKSFCCFSDTREVQRGAKCLLGKKGLLSLLFP